MRLDTRYLSLAVRVVGMFVLAEAVPNALFFAFGFIGMYQQWKQTPGASVDDLLWGQGPTTLHMLLRLALGVYLLRGGGVITRYCVRACEYACPACGHDLRSVSADMCPVCGCRNVFRGDSNNLGEQSPVTSRRACLIRRSWRRRLSRAVRRRRGQMSERPSGYRGLCRCRTWG